MRLREHGFCDRGHIPDFYGLIEHINPVHHLPYLQDFVEDTVYPNAILMEYVPDIYSIDLSNYSERRLRKLQQILLEMHRAGVYHGDPYPRNMMVQITSDRVLWIDFDRAQTFTSQSIKQCHLTWLERETRMMEEFVEGLVSLYCILVLFPYGQLTKRRRRQPMLSWAGFMRRGFATMSMCVWSKLH